MMKLLSGILFVLIFSPIVESQQVPDTTFIPNVTSTAFEKGEGPTICIDSAHNNLHRIDGGFAPFARLMRADGFRLKDKGAIINNKKVLSDCAIYVIVNPLHESNLGNWRLPNPSAFSEVEISEIEGWVKEGGRLFLIADHMPFAGAADELANLFGFNFSNGFARLQKSDNQPDIFSKDNGRLMESEITEGIESVTSFTGSAFTYPEEAQVIMKFKEEDISLEPEIAWQFSDSTKTIGLDNYAQGAVVNYGKGKLAVFGEAAMFTAQKISNQNGTFRVGFNSRLAPNNSQFISNLIHWLD